MLKRSLMMQISTIQSAYCKVIALQCVIKSKVIALFVLFKAHRCEDLRIIVGLYPLGLR